MVISMNRWKDKVAIVTGAGSGIGAAVVEQLINAGMKVACLDFVDEHLTNLSKKHDQHSSKLKTIRTDVTKEEDILRAFKWTKDNLGPVHVLVNCAGITRLTGLTNGDAKHWRDVLETNVLGLCIATREAVKDMRANNVDGHVIHINSIWGHGVYNSSFLPTLNLYPASKHAITALTETLRQELNAIGSKIKITSVSPGGVKTGILAATVKASGLSAEKVKEIESKAMEGRTTILEPEDVADAIVYALSTPPHVQIHELTIKPIGEPE